MSIFSPRKKPIPPPKPKPTSSSAGAAGQSYTLPSTAAQTGYPLTQTRSAGSAQPQGQYSTYAYGSPGLGVGEFGAYDRGSGLSSAAGAGGGGLRPPTTLAQRRSARDLREQDRALPDLPAHYLDGGGFLGGSAGVEQEGERDEVSITEVGYLCEGRQVTLGLQTVLGLVQVVGKELEAKALTTPLLFSTRALDLSSQRVRSLVRAFLRTLSRPGIPPEADADRRWREEVRLSGPHELAAVLRWGLARVVRVLGQTHLRGLVDIAAYDSWRSDEAAHGYPADAFLAFPPRLPAEVRPLLATLFPLLSRFAAHSTASGLTPIVLANTFGPLLFGLGLPSQPFTATYAAYLSASHATEHLLLAFIRLQDHELQQKSGVSLPPRLKDWLRGYPSMLPPPTAALDQPRKTSKLVRVLSVRRNVRLYSPNLFQTASAWPAETTPDQPIREWNRLAGPGKTAQPLYTEDYRKRLDLPLSALPASPYLRVPPPQPVKERVDGPTVLGTIVIPEAERFKSLTDLRWGMFESSGFDLPDPKRLEFDLNESARKRQPSKRDTIAWSDFANVGFTRDDFSLDFSPPVQESIASWPEHQAELHRKLRKQQKALPAFGWDTHPVHGRDKQVDEAFIDCFCDLLLSTGWMEREELTFRDCNWVLVEYRAAPEPAPGSGQSASTLTSTGKDNRTSSQWYVFEEFVPREYRESLLNPKKKKPGIFSVKTKKLLPIITNGGRGQGTVSAPRSPAREAEFERIISAPERGERVDNTRKLSLAGAAAISPDKEKPKLQISTPLQPGEHPHGKLRKPPFPLHPSSSVGPLNRLKALGRHSPATPSEETAVDVEFAQASLSDGSDPDEGRGGKRQQKPKEPWVDVRLADRNKQQPQLPASPVSQHAPPSPRPQEEESVMEPVQFARHEQLPTPEGPSPGSEYPVPEEYESEDATPIGLTAGQEFPLPPDRSANRRGIIFPSAGPSPPETEEEYEDHGDFEPYAEGTEGSESRHAEDEGEGYGEGEDDADAATDMSGPDHATPFDPHGPGGIPVDQWQSARGSNDRKHASGVSSLIELYQERDRQATLDVGPSRIPVRTTSPPNLPLGAPVRPTSPARAASPLTASPKGMQSSEGSALFEPDKIQANFPRYVHGAPLHNLMEAPEEEEEAE